jgi:hypothetical protein
VSSAGAEHCDSFSFDISYVSEQALLDHILGDNAIMRASFRKSPFDGLGSCRDDARKMKCTMHYGFDASRHCCIAIIF